MHLKPLIIVASALALSSCFSMGSTPVYQSHAPETRGERAISSNIELAREVDLDNTILGVFYSHEVYQSGDAHTLLFTRREKSLGSAAQGTMNDYNLSETASMSVDQGRKLLSAIDNYLSMDPKSLTPNKMYNFELYSGTLNMREGSDKYRPFEEITFVVVCSVTNSKKVFKTVFPTTTYDLYGRASITYSVSELKDEQVKSLREAIAAALSLAPAAPATSGGSGA